MSFYNLLILRSRLIKQGGTRAYLCSSFWFANCQLTDQFLWNQRWQGFGTSLGCWPHCLALFKWLNSLYDPKSQYYRNPMGKHVLAFIVVLTKLDRIDVVTVGKTFPNVHIWFYLILQDDHQGWRSFQFSISYKATGVTVYRVVDLNGLCCNDLVWIRWLNRLPL